MMMIPAKILEKKLRLRSIIFVRGSISRQELIRESGLNERTVISYAQELEDHQMIRSETVSVSRGRPGIIYHSRSETCFFLGMRLSALSFHVAVCDINGFPVSVQGISFVEGMEESARLESVFSVLEPYMGRYGQGILGKVGLAYDVTLSAKLGSVNRLAGEIQRRYHVICEVFYNDDLGFWELASNSGRSGTMLGIACGSRLYASLVSGDELIPLRPTVLQQMCHLTVAPDSDLQCSCKKYGCAERELTYGGVLHRYQRAAGKALPDLSAKHNYKQIFIRAQSGDRIAQEVFAETWRLMERVIIGFASLEHVDYVGLLSGRYWLQPQSSRPSSGVGSSPPVIRGGVSNAENVFLPALYVLHRTLHYQQEFMGGVPSVSLR